MVPHVLVAAIVASLPAAAAMWAVGVGFARNVALLGAGLLAVRVAWRYQPAPEATPAPEAVLAG